MMKKFLTLFIGSQLFTMAATAHAGENAYGDWYALPGFGYANIGSALKAEDTHVESFKIGKQMSESWDLQFGASFLKASNNLAGHAGKYNQTLLGLDALYMFDRKGLMPFVLAGGGFANNSTDYRLNNTNVGGSSPSWMVNVGAGVQYAFSEVIGLQADVRHVLSEVKTPTGNKQNEGNTFLTLSLMINLDAIKKPVVNQEVAPEPKLAIAPSKEPAPIVNPSRFEEPQEPAPKAVESAPAVCQPKVGKFVISAEALFDFDKAVIRKDGKQVLDSAAAKLNSSSNLDMSLILVTGHSDQIGSMQYNQKLSEQRANVVKTYLQMQGVNPTRLSAIGKGETEPVVSCKGLEGPKLIRCLAPNRSVVLSAEKFRESGCE
jgi:OOP family OmpA-OmpF porin